MNFTIIIPPKGQMRGRSTGRIIKGGGKKGQDIAVSRVHKHDNQLIEEERLISLITKYRPEVPLAGPIMLGVRAYLPIPKKSKKWMRAALAGEIRPETKPDLDNLEKHLKDCCKGIFWGDDKQVVGHTPEFGKYYGDPPRWEIEIITLDEYRAGLVQRYEGLIRQLTEEDRVIRESFNVESRLAEPTAAGRLF
jgi:Holliday junction resolvase RusA-like endonuclease